MQANEDGYEEQNKKKNCYPVSVSDLKMRSFMFYLTNQGDGSSIVASAFAGFWMMQPFGMMQASGSFSSGGR